MSRRVTPAAGAYALTLLVVLVFSPAFGNRFINLDDPLYIARNPMVQSGFTRASVRWAFTSFDAANWHPLTWLSHQLDTQLFGALPFGPHLMNVGYHAAAAALLFVLLRRLTGALWPAFFAAALFAVHPLRVESVAWAAERKDVLSGCFWMLTLLAYLASVRRPDARRRLLVVALFALGLMAKPMLVTLPAILLVLDWWPLGRLAGPGPVSARCGKLLREKLSLFVLAALSTFITIRAQASGGAIATFGDVPFGERLANAAVATTTYLAKMAAPTNLAILYPYPRQGTPLAAAVGAGIVLALATAAVLTTAKRRPYLLAGWLWYLVALLPVLGLLQVGRQARADRYTYLPGIGIAVAVVWLITGLCRRRRARLVAAGIGAAAILAAAVAARSYLAAWSDGEHLLRKALVSQSDSSYLHFWLGGALAQNGRLDEAIVEFSRGVALAPQFADGEFSLGYCLEMKGESARAAAHYRRALALDPRHADAHKYLGDSLARTGDPAGAEAHFRAALNTRPEYAEARTALCALLARPREPFEIPLFPACGGAGENVWARLDKAGPENYVEEANRRPRWAFETK